VLLDEIEKAHPDVFNMLLQILEDGRLTDNKGRTVSFDNAVIIMTSNIGAELIPDSREMRDRYEEVHALLMRELQEVFRPEFLNRVDEVIVFHALSDEELVRIADLLLDRVRRLASSQGLTLEVSEAAKRRIAREGSDSTFGARPLRRAIQKLIETPVSKKIISGNLGSGDVVLVDLDPNGVVSVAGQAGDGTIGAPADPATEEEPDATHAARQKAEELGVDLSQVEGSGARGRITVKDVVSVAHE
jgi:ATP-dependent Clp protease ATP-binding subunit ClpC